MAAKRATDAIITMNVRDFAGASESYGESYGVRILKPGDLVAELRKEEQRATILFVCRKP